jgi:ElaB/YqjD/DUF883 family membrane-anchored ribosome-binding protein
MEKTVMESTVNDNNEGLRADAKLRMTDGGEASLELHGSGSQEARRFIADMQVLLGRVAHLADPEIARLRARVEHGFATARKTFTDGTDRVQRHAKDVMNVGNGYVRDQPWQAAGISAVAGLVVGFLVARR